MIDECAENYEDIEQEQRASINSLLAVLEALYKDDFEYEVKNNLGDGFSRHNMRWARQILENHGVHLGWPYNKK